MDTQIARRRTPVIEIERDRRRDLQNAVWGFALVAAAVALVVGMVVAWVVMRPRFLARQDALDRFPGRIIALEHRGGEDDPLDATVRFGPNSDEQRTAVVGGVGEGRWREGQRVTVLVDPDDASFVTLPGENYVPDWFWGRLVVAGFVALGAAIGGGHLLDGVPRRRRASARADDRLVERPHGVVPVGEPLEAGLLGDPGDHAHVDVVNRVPRVGVRSAETDLHVGLQRWSCAP